MRRAVLIAIDLLVAVCGQGQRITLAVDSTCGCDIVYVDGIETTREGERYGFRRSDGTVVAPNIYRHVDRFSGGYCRVWAADTTAAAEGGAEPGLVAGLIDSTGREVVPCQYDAVGLPSSGRIMVMKGGLIGFADLEGEMVIPLEYRDASPFVQGRAAVGVLVDSAYLLYTFIDTLGRELFAPQFQSAQPFLGGYAAVRRYDRWGIIDTLGREVIPCIYEHLSTPDHNTLFAGDADGLALFRLAPPASQALTPFVYRPVTLLSDGRIGVSRNGKQGFLDTLGREVIPCIYDEIGRFGHGRAMVRIDSRCGIIDTLGRTVLALEYEDRSPKGMKYVYYDSLALVEKGGRLGYVDLEGKVVVPLVLEEAYQYSEGLAAVRKEGLWGYLDSQGDIFIPFIFTIAAPFQYGRADVYLGSQHLAIDHKGRCVKNCKGIVSFR